MRSLSIRAVERSLKREALTFQEWARLGDGAILDDVFDSSSDHNTEASFFRVTIKSNPKLRGWGISRERLITVFCNPEQVVWLGPKEPAGQQHEFDALFEGFTMQAPTRSAHWGNADAFFTCVHPEWQFRYAVRLARLRGQRLCPDWVTPSDIQWDDLLNPSSKRQLSRQREDNSEYGGVGPYYADLEQSETKGDSGSRDLGGASSSWHSFFLLVE